MDAQQAPLILVCDDDVNVYRSLLPYLLKENYDVVHAADGLQALDIVRTRSVDLVVLDIMMPGLDGVEVAKRIRKQSNLPIIMLTARGEEIDKLIALDSGADDYVTKPFSPREVVARVRAVLRRLGESQAGDAKKALSCGNLYVNLAEYTVRIDGQDVHCSPKEVEILYLLMSRPGTVFTREQLLDMIWGYDFFGDTRAVDSHIKRMRAKLSRPDNPWDIKTVWGVGYKFEIEHTP